VYFLRNESMMGGGKFEICVGLKNKKKCVYEIHLQFFGYLYSIKAVL